jgi:hypothetical protein
LPLVGDRGDLPGCRAKYIDGVGIVDEIHDRDREAAA